MQRTHPALFLICVILLFSCENPSVSEKNDPANIVLIVADDLGFTDLGSYGSEIKTPNLDALAQSGIRNQAFYTLPTCSPTRAMF